MNECKKVVVASLFCCNCSRIVRILLELGVYMGNADSLFCEERWLSKALRAWWCEPEFIESSTALMRQTALNQWLSVSISGGAGWVGAHHPLLSLCLADILQIWKDVRFIWVRNPLGDSISALRQASWWPEANSTGIQTRIWDELTNFSTENNCLKVDPSRLDRDSEELIKEIALHIEKPLSEFEIQRVARAVAPMGKSAAVRPYRRKEADVKVLGCFDHAVVIHLDRNPDRLVRTTQELDIHGISFSVLNAIAPTHLPDSHKNAVLGCLMSHRAAVAWAQSEGLQNILIFEDDIVLRRDFVALWSDVEAKVGNLDYDMFYFYSWRDHSLSHRPITLRAINTTQCTHCYAVNASFFDKYLSIVDREISSGWPTDLDLLFHAPEVKCFATSYNLAGQRAGKSDLGNHKDRDVFEYRDW